MGRIINALKGDKASIVGGDTYTWENKGEDILHKIPKVIVFNDNVVVREDEYAVFFRDGKALAVFDRPARYALTTQNIATFGLANIVKDVTGVRQIGELYYVRKNEVRGKFGTREPIAFRDTDFGIVRIRIFGQFAFRITEPLLFITQFVGTEGKSSSETIIDWMRDQIIMSLNDILGELKRDKHMAVIDMAAYLEEMEQLVLSRLADDFMRYGVEMTKIAGLNINLPDEIQKAIDQRGQLQALGVNYMQYQAGQAMVKAAENPSGGNIAGLGVGLGAGVGMGVGMSGAMQAGMQPGQPNPWGAPPPGTAAPPSTGKKCPKCGQPIDEGQKFCNNCGEKLLEERMCVKCGKPMGTAKFCPECGAKQTVSCPKCGKETSAMTKFCPECGSKI